MFPKMALNSTKILQYLEKDWIVPLFFGLNKKGIEKTVDFVAISSEDSSIFLRGRYIPSPYHQTQIVHVVVGHVWQKSILRCSMKTIHHLHVKLLTINLSWLVSFHSRPFFPNLWVCFINYSLFLIPATVSWDHNNHTTQTSQFYLRQFWIELQYRIKGFPQYISVQNSFM